MTLKLPRSAGLSSGMSVTPRKRIGVVENAARLEALLLGLGQEKADDFDARIDQGPGLHLPAGEHAPPRDGRASGR